MFLTYLKEYFRVAFELPSFTQKLRLEELFELRRIYRTHYFLMLIWSVILSFGIATSIFLWEFTTTSIAFLVVDAILSLGLFFQAERSNRILRALREEICARERKAYGG